ncbi:MAG: hypothetical protein R2716_04605 [Microthrixaceae bacterium]
MDLHVTICYGRTAERPRASGDRATPVRRRLLDPTRHPLRRDRGELYRVTEDPHQWWNLWDDLAYRSVRKMTVADLRAPLSEDAPPRGGGAGADRHRPRHPARSTEPCT